MRDERQIGSYRDSPMSGELGQTGFNNKQSFYKSGAAGKDFGTPFSIFFRI